MIAVVSPLLVMLVAVSQVLGPVTGGQGTDLARRAAETGTLRVKSDVSDVEVYLDNKEAGRTPLTLTAITAGPHRILLIKQGYEDHAEQIQVNASRTSSIFVVMRPLPTKLPDLPVQFKVIHQHRLGHCAGVLTVTAESLDYKSEKGDDVFHLPIAQLKSVSRSWGPVAGVRGINAPTELMAFRVEAPGRQYGFLAFKETEDDPMSVASTQTKELFELVYTLWSATLKTKEK